MVKSVVKPLKMGFLRERIVPKKSVFTKAFGVLCFGIPWGRCPAPKARALPTALHPEILNSYLYLRLSAALPVVTKPLTSQGSSLGKSLPLLIARFVTRGVRSQTSPTSLHPERNLKKEGTEVSVPWCSCGESNSGHLD